MLSILTTSLLKSTPHAYILDRSAIFPQTKGHLYRGKIGVYDYDQIPQGVLHPPYLKSVCGTSGIVKSKGKAKRYS